MIDKEKIKNFFIYTGIIIVLVLALVQTSKFMRDTSNYIDESIRYQEWKKFEKEFEKEMERFGVEHFKKSQLWKEQEKKNPLPLELRRERFISERQILGLHKKYLTDMEFTAFCILYREMQERQLNAKEVELMMYFILKVTHYATPEEKKIFEEGQELSKKMENHVAPSEPPTEDKK
ncbi:MAG: hypothetical protein QG657_1754 [Acidobacteriota bacterium]|nr:hypothetical protein [Acidobacteriota bacterium]